VGLHHPDSNPLGEEFLTVGEVNWESAVRDQVVHVVRLQEEHLQKIFLLVVAPTKYLFLLAINQRWS
jgi:hypothetical protein